MRAHYINKNSNVKTALSEANPGSRNDKQSTRGNRNEIPLFNKV